MQNQYNRQKSYSNSAGNSMEQKLQSSQVKFEGINYQNDEIISEVQETENLRQHLQNLMTQMYDNKKISQMQQKRQYKSIRQNKLKDNLQRKQLYDKDMINRKGFKRSVQQEVYFEKNTDIFNKKEGAIGKNIGHTLIQPEKAKEFGVVKVNKECNLFGKTPQEQLSQKEKTRLDKWSEINSMQWEQSYEDMLKSQIGKYKKQKIEKVEPVKPFKVQNKLMESCDMDKSAQYSLGRVSKIYYNEKARVKVERELEDQGFNFGSVDTVSVRSPNRSGLKSQMGFSRGSEHSRMVTAAGNRSRIGMQKSSNGNQDGIQRFYLPNIPTNNSEYYSGVDNSRLLTSSITNRQKFSREQQWKPQQQKAQLFTKNIYKQDKVKMKSMDLNNASMNLSGEGNDIQVYA